jgi:hypothetical protein
VLFEGQLRPVKKQRGVLSLFRDDLQTPLGLALTVDAWYHAGMDSGRLSVRSPDGLLAEVAPLMKDRFLLVLSLPSGEELEVAALSDR